MANSDQADSNGNGVGDACEHHVISAWRSVKSHGGTDLAIGLDTSKTAAEATMDPRGGGVSRIQIDFDGPVTLNNTAAVTVAGGGGYTATLSQTDADTLEAAVTPTLADGGCYTLTIAPAAIKEVLDLADPDCCIRTLEGDTTANGTVNLGDVLYVQSLLGQSVANYPPLDVNGSGGIIDADDMQQIKNRVTSPALQVTCP